MMPDEIAHLINGILRKTEENSAPTPYESFRILLERLNSPQLSLPPVIHVAGTNGKGSTLAYLNSVFQASGLKVHRYTSPHLLSICERIQTANYLIQENQLLQHLRHISEHVDSLSLTFFQILTAAAFLEFSQTKADYLLLETGLGGRLDPTNVIEKPVATVITQIGMDHMDVLGPQLKDIVHAKAGIIKSQCPVFTFEQDEIVMDILRQEANHQRAPFIISPLDLSLKPSLPGQHQIINASLAARVAQELGFSNKVIHEGIAHTLWPGRMQKIRLYNRDVWLDMAHNESAAEAAVIAMEELGQSPFHLIFSLRQTKDLQGFLSSFRDCTLSLTYVPIHASYTGGHPIEDISSTGLNIRIAETFAQALTQMPAGPILVAGSALLLSQALTIENQERPQ